MKKISVGIAALGIMSSVVLSGCSSHGLPTDQIPQGLGDTKTTASPTDSASSPTVTPTSSGMPVVDKNPTVPQPPAEVSVNAPLPLPTDGFDYSNPDKTEVRQLPPGPIDKNGKITGNIAEYQAGNAGGSTQPNTTTPELVDKVGAGSDADKKNAAESYIKYINFKSAGNFTEACKYVRLAVGSTTTCEAKLAAVDVKFNPDPSGLKIDRVSNVNIDGDKAEMVPAVFIYEGSKRLAKVEMFRTADPSVWQIVL